MNVSERRKINNRAKAVTAYRLRSQGLTHNEIADHLDLKPEHVKSMILLGERMESLNEVSSETIK